MIGIVWAYPLFNDDDCDEEEEAQQQTAPRTGQSNGGDTTQNVSGRSSESRRTGTRQKRAPKRFVHSVVKKSRNLSGTHTNHPLVPYPVSPPTKEEVDALEALLASIPQPTDYGTVPLKTDQTTHTEPLPSQMDPPAPPSPTSQEVICPFHSISERRRLISVKGWDYIKCPGEWCPYWVPAAEAAVSSEMTRSQLHEEIAGGPWRCYCWEGRLVTKNPNSLIWVALI